MVDFGKGINRSNRLQPPEIGLQPLDPRSNPGKKVKILGHPALNAGAQHFDRDLVTRCSDREMNLGNGGGSHRPVIETRKQIVNSFSQLLFDQGTGDVGMKGGS